MPVNIRRYIETYLKIKTKDGKVIPFKFNKPQEKVYEVIKQQRELGKAPRIIILKSRQMGMSTFVEGINFGETNTNPNVSAVIMAHTIEATTNLFNMFKFYYDNLPEQLRPQVLASNAKELVFNNKEGTGLNSKIRCLTANAQGAGRSSTVQYVHASEFAFWDGDKNATLAGLLQAVPNIPDSMVAIESTANGFDEFKDFWDKAVNGENDFIPLFFPWFEMDEYRKPYEGFELTKEEEEIKAKFNLSNDQLQWRRWCIANNCQGNIDTFHQEYPSTPEEAFISTGRCVFDTIKINKRLQEIEPPIKRGQFEFSYNGLTIYNMRWVDDPKGCISIYEAVQPRHPYVIGGDTAGEGSDFFIGQVLDNTNGKQVAILRHQFDEDLYARQMYCLGMYYNSALLGIETNFSTFPQKELQRLKYPKFFIREVEDTYTRRLNQTFGFKTTKLTRPLVLADLVQIMRENISLINDRTTLNEALTFVKNSEGRMEAIEGKHDDTIMALAIAYYIRIQQRTKPSDEIGSKEKDFISANFSTKKEGKGGYINWRED
jgi:hypothetical protein